MRAVDERVEVDLAGARDAGPDVPADVALCVFADRLGCLGRGLGRQAADEKADGAVEVVDGVDRLLGHVADIGERLVLKRVADLGNAGEIPAAVVDVLEVRVEIFVQVGREAVAVAGFRGAVEGYAQVDQDGQEQAGDGRDEDHQRGRADAGAGEGGGAAPDHAAGNGGGGHSG